MSKAWPFFWLLTAGYTLTLIVVAVGAHS